LGSASQAALSKAFNTRKTALENAQKPWLQLFGFGIFMIFALTTISIMFADDYNFPPLITAKSFDVWGVFTRLLISGPFLWLSWFAVRQYSNNVKTIEDYAFKEASALAFVGYQNDMRDDLEMIKLLRESAIKNFSFPPSRLLGKTEPVSPTHDLLEKFFNDKDTFNQFLESLKPKKPTDTNPV